MENIFYQSSLPRAGSTLLQNILAQNPDIYATPTSGCTTTQCLRMVYLPKMEETFMVDGLYSEASLNKNLLTN